MKGFAYGILGAGRQGTAAAYDLIVRGEAASVALADLSLERARAAADRVNRLSRTNLASATQLDIAAEPAVIDFLRPLDAAVSSASWRLNLGVAEAAPKASTHVCDLGGNMGVVRRQLELDAQAKESGICIVPDCGEAPPGVRDDAPGRDR